jgi:hypothetical protein
VKDDADVERVEPELSLVLEHDVREGGPPLVPERGGPLLFVAAETGLGLDFRCSHACHSACARTAEQQQRGDTAVSGLTI